MYFQHIIKQTTTRNKKNLERIKYKLLKNKTNILNQTWFRLLLVLRRPLVVHVCVVLTFARHDVDSPPAATESHHKMKCIKTV